MNEVTSARKELIDFEKDFYGAFKLIDWFDLERVRKARIMVIGAGAIGNEVLKNLALLGVGHIYIWDRDTIEMSNLSRSILYRPRDCNQLKAKVAARALREINPDVQTYWHNGDIRFDLGLGLVRRMDVIIGCLDNKEARLAINKICYRAGRPWIDAGIGQLNGQVRAFMPDEGACYECSFTDEDYQQVAMPCNRLASIYASQGKIPTTPTIASIVAGIQVQEALKLIDYQQWQGRTLVGRELIFNGTVGDVSIADLPVRPACPAHYTLTDADIVALPEMSVKRTTVAQLLAEARARVGRNALIELNFELAVEVFCPTCQTAKKVWRPKDKMFQEDLLCAVCQKEGALRTTHLLGEPDTHYQYNFSRAKLARIHVPPLDILVARGLQEAEIHLELTGDLELH